MMTMKAVAIGAALMCLLSACAGETGEAEATSPGQEAVQAGQAGQAGEAGTLTQVEASGGDVQLGGSDKPQPDPWTGDTTASDGEGDGSGDTSGGTSSGSGKPQPDPWARQKRRSAATAAPGKPQPDPWYGSGSTAANVQ